jgi:hypothetical protein
MPPLRSFRAAPVVSFSGSSGRLRPTRHVPAFVFILLIASSFCVSRGAALPFPPVDGNTVVMRPLDLTPRANHHLVLDVRWQVLDAAARGGALIRVARDAASLGEPLLQFFAAVSGCWSALAGGAGLAPPHCAELSAPHPGVHQASIRVYPRPGGALEPSDFGSETLLEVSSFGRSFHLLAANLRWVPSGSLLILR